MSRQGNSKPANSIPPTSPVTQFLRDIAARDGYRVFNDLFGTIDLGAKLPITQSSGAVYGIWVQSSTPPRPNLQPIPGHAEWFPVYWGKDIAPASRMKAHVKGHRNGNINLPSVREVQGKPLIFGAILVANYRAFEVHLHNVCRPMLGTAAPGRASTVIRIENETK